MAALTDILAFTNQYLNIDQFEDYCPNGLQVNGRAEVKKILTGVTASQALLNGAVDTNVDMILVHHGYFWKGEDSPIVGLKYEKIKTLVMNNISLVAYHLPLDAHPVCGNNIQLANKLGVNIKSCFGPGKVPLVVAGELSAPVEVQKFVEIIWGALGRKPLHIGAKKNKKIKKVAICTGGAQNYFATAISNDVDVFITGEVSEQNYHMAIESGVDFISAGHHATERYGVQALGRMLTEKFMIESNYFEIDNPV